MRPGSDGAAGPGPAVDRGSLGRRRGAGRVAVRCTARRPAAGVELETLGDRERGDVGCRCPHFRVHDLRHAAASVWLAAGADPKAVERVLGHATAAMTMDLYGHMVDADLWQAAQLVGARRGHLSHPREAFERTAGRAQVRKTPRSWAFWVGAAYRNRTDDLRITRSPAHRSRRATCTDGSTHVPERSLRTGCSRLPVHDSVHGLGQPLGNRMLLGWTLMAHDLGHRDAGHPCSRGLGRVRRSPSYA